MRLLGSLAGLLSLVMYPQNGAMPSRTQIGCAFRIGQVKDDDLGVALAYTTAHRSWLCGCAGYPLRGVRLAIVGR